MTQRSKLIDKISQQGLPPIHSNTAGPIVSLEEFFDGNQDVASIGCNVRPYPGLDVFYDVLCNIRSRADVQDVLVEIHEIPDDERDWPFSERVYVLTSATPDVVCGWLGVLDPSEVEEGWASEAPIAAPTLQPGMHVVGAWWD